MFALKVLINGQIQYVAGIVDWDSLHAVIMALRSDDDEREHTIDLKIGGLAQQVDPEKLMHARWSTVDLQVGDEISISIIETNAVDKPIKRYRSDKAVQENPLTDEELFELQKQDYLMLKEKFKNEDFA